MNENNDFDTAKQVLDKYLAVLVRRERAPAFVIDPAFSDVMMELMRLTLEANENISLTTITEPEEFVRLHILDSLSCVGLPELELAQSVIDVGCGSGFPSLPLAALYPEKRFFLLDSLRKRIEFVTFAAKELRFFNVSALHSRAEKSGQDLFLREQFDLSLCRAVGKLSQILEYSLPFVRIGGSGFFYKTIRAEGEIENSLLARELLGGSPDVRVFTYTDILPGRAHAIYIVNKVNPTPGTYPRREGIPAKVPL